MNFGGIGKFLLGKVTYNKVQFGIYFKGNLYQVIGVARHSETNEEVVVYQALYGEQGLWVRPKQMFLEKVLLNGKHVARFHYIGDEAK